MNILAMPGSLRSGSSNTALLEAAARLAPPGTNVVVYRGLGDLPHFNADLDAEGLEPPAPVAELRAQISAASALIISCPEYAHGVPGSMKNALDWLVSYADFAGKPVALWNASAAGGEHAQSALVEIVKTMSARIVIEASLLAPFLRRKLEPGGDLDEESALLVRSSLAALVAAA